MNLMSIYNGKSGIFLYSIISNTDLAILELVNGNIVEVFGDSSDFGLDTEHVSVDPDGFVSIKG